VEVAGAGAARLTARALSVGQRDTVVGHRRRVEKLMVVTTVDGDGGSGGGTLVRTY